MPLFVVRQLEPSGQMLRDVTESVLGPIDDCLEQGEHQRFVIGDTHKAALEECTTILGRATLESNRYNLPMLQFCVVACLTLLAHEPKTITGKVVAIADGDTLTVLDDAKVQHKIGLHGIDAPDNLAAKVFGKFVLVEVVDVDRYRREVERIHLEDRFVNLEMLRDGIAWRYVGYDMARQTRPVSAGNRGTVSRPSPRRPAKV